MTMFWLCFTKGARTFVISGYMDQGTQSQLEKLVKKYFLLCSGQNIFFIQFLRSLEILSEQQCCVVKVAIINILVLEMDNTTTCM